MGLLERLFQFFSKEKVVQVEKVDNSCICERNARGENISGWCSKHHEDWL